MEKLSAQSSISWQQRHQQGREIIPLNDGKPKPFVLGFTLFPAM
jgi:hypothetical protein